MIRYRLLAAGAILFLTAIPASAQNRGGRPGGGFPGGGGYRGGSGFSLSFGIGGIGLGGIGLGGLGFGGGYGGLGGYGGSPYRSNFSNGNFGNGGYSGNGGYYRTVPSYNYQPTYIAPQATYTYPAPVYNAVVNPASVPQTPAANPAFPLGTETGLRITELAEGTAKVAGLRKGDIILKVDGTRTQSFEELRATLSTGKAQVVVEFIDGTSGETERKTIGVDGTKIGVTVAETAIPRT